MPRLSLPTRFCKQTFTKIKKVKSNDGAIIKEYKEYKKYKDRSDTFVFKIKKYCDGTTYAYTDRNGSTLFRSANGKISLLPGWIDLKREIPSRRVALMLEKFEARPDNAMGFKEFVAAFFNPKRSPQEAIPKKSKFPAYDELPANLQLRHIFIEPIPEGVGAKDLGKRIEEAWQGVRKFGPVEGLDI